MSKYKTEFMALVAVVFAAFFLYVITEKALPAIENQTFRISMLSCTDGKSSFTVMSMKTVAFNDTTWCAYPMHQEGKEWIAVRTCFINMPMACRTEATEGHVKSSEITIRD